MNGFDLSTISGLFIGAQEYTKIYKGSTTIWESTPNYYNKYLTIESLEDNNIIGFKTYNSSSTARTIEYSIDEVNWTSVSSSYEGTTITTLNTGDKLYLRGNDRTATGEYNYSYFTSTKTFNLYGNILSLLYNYDFKNYTVIAAAKTHCFLGLFRNTKVVSAVNLALPSNTTTYCYEYMFQTCTSLTTPPPALPAGGLSNYCYRGMFQGCSSLTTAPALPATTLANYCYQGMFNNCSSITTAPALTATTLKNYCYMQMFQGCSSLTTAPALPATTLVSGCYDSMFYNCTGLTSAPALPATTLAESCYGSMFRGCTGLTSAPALPATTLAENCYSYMFGICTSLTTAPVLPATTLVSGCYSHMFHGCSSLTTAPALPVLTLANYCYQYMFTGCTSLTTAPELPATTLTQYCYQYMFQNCTKLTTAPELPATTLATYCYQYMFSGCTALTTAPELPALVLTSYCYRYMFENCSSINYIKMLATNKSATNCLYNWVNGVAATGTFVKNIEATWTTTGVSGIPSGWTVQEYDPTVKSNASINLYTNYNTGSSTTYNVIHSLTTGTNYSWGSDTSAWHYGKNKNLSGSTNRQYMSVAQSFKLNIVFTGLTQFKVFLIGSLSDNVGGVMLNKLNDDTNVAYGDYSSGNEHCQVYAGRNSGTDYTYTNLDPNTKYNIAINFRCNASTSESFRVLIPTSYPQFNIINNYFTSSSEYNEVYGS